MAPGYSKNCVMMKMMTPLAQWQGRHHSRECVEEEAAHPWHPGSKQKETSTGRVVLLQTHHSDFTLSHWMPALKSSASTQELHEFLPRPLTYGTFGDASNLWHKASLSQQVTGCFLYRSEARPHKQLEENHPSLLTLTDVSK